MAEISIIIPTFNRANFVGETLDSISVQTFRDWECIVIDDGSTDATSELMGFYTRKDQRFKYYKRPVNVKKGANACRNYGFEISNGDYINWFDSDDIMHPKKLELQVIRVANTSSDFVVCKTSAFEGDKNNILGLRHKSLASDKPLFDYIKMKIGWMTPSVLWKRSFLLSLSYLFDEGLKSAQEWEFHTRVLTHKPNYIVLDKSLDLVRKHSSTITYNDNEQERFWNYFQARLRIYNNHKLILDKNSKKYLSSYLLNSFKKMIVTKNPFVFRAYRSYLWPSEMILPVNKFYGLLAIISFRLLNKGNFFLQKLKYK